MTRLTDEELAMVRTLVPAECVGLLAYVDAMTAELRTLRAAALTEKEVAALKWAGGLLTGEAHRRQGAAPHGWHNNVYAVLTILDKLTGAR